APAPPRAARAVRRPGHRPMRRTARAASSCAPTPTRDGWRGRSEAGGRATRARAGLPRRWPPWSAASQRDRPRGPRPPPPATAPRWRRTSPSAPARTRRTRRVLGDLHAAGGDVSEEVGSAHHHDVGTGARHLAPGELVCLLEAVVDAVEGMDLLPLGGVHREL